MTAKAILVLCASVLVQSAYTAFVGGIAGPGYASTGCGFNGLAGPLPYESFLAPGRAYEGAAGFGCGSAGVASTGGGLPCASASPIPPVGVSVVSENSYEGVLAAGGKLPFVGTVAVEGVLPTAGAGAVSYGCGDGIVGIAAEEGPVATGIAPHVPAPYAPYGAYGSAPVAAAYNGFDGFGYGVVSTGFGAGCGYGAIY